MITLYITDMLHTDLHECVSATAPASFSPEWTATRSRRTAARTREEARADPLRTLLPGRPKLIELGILDNPEACKAEYYKFMMNGLMTQLNRIELGNDVEEAHMRNRQLIAKWALKHGKSRAKAVRM